MRGVYGKNGKHYSELQLGIDDLERGNLIAAETVRENLNNKYNL